MQRFSSDWTTFCHTNHLKELFENINRDDILSFWWEIKIIPKIINVNMISTMESNYSKNYP